MSHVGLFFITLGLVFVKAFQQRNVAYGHIGLIPPTAFVFAALEMASIGIVAEAFIAGEDLVLTWLALACGASIGCVTAVRVHQTYVRRKR